MEHCYNQQPNKNQKMLHKSKQNNWSNAQQLLDQQPLLKYY